MGANMTQIDYGKAEEAAREFNEKVQDIADTFTNAFGAALAKMQPDLQAISQALRPLYNHVYDAYLREGAPYGETHEGFMRWYKVGK